MYYRSKFSLKMAPVVQDETCCWKIWLTTHFNKLCNWKLC
jgi:hypothetical protein